MPLCVRVCELSVCVYKFVILSLLYIYIYIYISLCVHMIFMLNFKRFLAVKEEDFLCI